MKKIANIVYKGKNNPFSEMFNVVRSYDDIVKGLPTLIIGWENAKQCIDNIEILKKEYDDVCWTFSKTERRCDYEDDIINFYEKVILSAMDRVKYIYVDLTKYSYGNIKKMVNYLKSDDKKTIFLTKGSSFMFVYSEKYNTVFGISLTMCEYIGILKRKVISLVNNGDFINDTSFINSDIRRIIGTKTHYILPLYEYFR